MTMTLSQSLSPPQVAQLFPLLLRFVHVSTMSHHANCILIPFRLEWFRRILDAERFLFFCMMQYAWECCDVNAACMILLCFFFILHVYALLTATARQLFFTQAAQEYRHIMNTKLWPGCSILAVQALLSELDLSVKAEAPPYQITNLQQHTQHVHSWLWDLEDCLCKRTDLCSLWFNRKTRHNYFTSH